MTPAVVGIGQAAVTPGAEASAASLVAHAIDAALRDAGVCPEDVDGVVRLDREAVWEYDLPGVMRFVGLGYYGVVPDAPGCGPALLRLAAMAISQGLARVVLGYHARAEPRPPLRAEVLSAACGVATDDGPPGVPSGCAFVVSAPERAGSRAVRILGSMQAAVPSAARHLDAWLASRRDGVVRDVARRLYVEARLRPDDVDVACLYARPAALVRLALDDFGFGRGARPRVNPHHGRPDATALDGVDDVLEAVRQLRGEAAVQVAGVRVALAAASPLEPTSAVLLGASS